MDSIDLEVLRTCEEWIAGGRQCELVTVIRTWGSSPRPEGATLAVNEEGQVIGSVSGGCVEDDLIARLRAGERAAGLIARVRARDQAAALPSLIAYGVSREEAARFGLPCGGTLRLVQEPLGDVAWIEEVLRRMAAHRLVARTLTLASGQVALADAPRGAALQFDGLTLTSVFGPRWRLLLIGAGQLSQAVASIALMLDFEVLVCEPREEYAATLNMPGATRLPGMPDDVVRALLPDAHTAIVALTHDPKLDDMALLEALTSEAFYVGALGSARNQAARRQRLAEHFELSDAELDRLHGPVGLRIGAKTPAEIAVSVMAQIVQVKNAQPAAAQPASAPAAAARG